jgi:hypothetical protein
LFEPGWKFVFTAKDAKEKQIRWYRVIALEFSLDFVGDPGGCWLQSR